jgi:predicted DsbA family dithiol-disulfide isomerase
MNKVCEVWVKPNWVRAKNIYDRIQECFSSYHIVKDLDIHQIKVILDLADEVGANQTKVKLDESGRVVEGG